MVLWDFLRQLKAAGTTVLITSHYLEEIDALADRLAIIDKGIVIDEGTPSELKDQVGGDRVTLRIREFTPKEEASKAQSLLESLDFVKSDKVATVLISTPSRINLVIKECLRA